MKAIAGAFVIALVVSFTSTAAIDACGGMTTVNPPDISMDDYIDPPSFDDADPFDYQAGECVV
jgi:hypothetical protein